MHFKLNLYFMFLQYNKYKQLKIYNITEKVREPTVKI